MPVEVVVQVNDLRMLPTIEVLGGHEWHCHPRHSDRAKRLPPPMTDGKA